MNINIFSLLKRTFKEWSDDNATRLAAALSFYTIFSLAPLLLIVISLGSLLISPDIIRGEVNTQVQSILGTEGASFITSLLKNQRSDNKSILPAVIGSTTLLLGALGVFGQLKGSLNDIWNVKPSRKGFAAIVINNFFSFLMVLVIGAVLLFSFIASTSIAIINKYFETFVPFSPVFLEFSNMVISFVISTILFSLMYKLLPDAKVAWKDVWLGAILTSLLFVIGKFLIGFYLGFSATATQFGAASSLIIILLWIYYYSQILFFGAEFTKVYANMYGSKSKNKSS